MQTMYSASAGSPSTTLNGAIDSTQTAINVIDANVLPAAPNLVTIGEEPDAEVVLYATKTATSLTGCTRGIETTAKAWTSGTTVCRTYTTYDHKAFTENIRENNIEVTGTLPASPKANQIVYHEIP